MANKLLVVDDDDGVRRLMKRVFERAGYQVVLAGDGQEALSMIAREDFSLMLLDVNLPRLDGLEVLRAVREVSPKLPVIVISGLMDEEKAKIFLREGARDYLTKPIDCGSLERSVLAQLL